METTGEFIWKTMEMIEYSKDRHIEQNQYIHQKEQLVRNYIYLFLKSFPDCYLEEISDILKRFEISEYPFVFLEGMKKTKYKIKSKTLKNLKP